MAAQLAFSGWLQTLVPALCGLIAGALYRTDVGNIKQWRFPILLQSLTKKVIGYFFMTAPNPRSSATVPVQRPIITSLGSVNNLLPTGIPAGTEPNRTVGRSSAEYLDTITNRDVTGSDLEPPSPEYTRVLMSMFPNHPRETITRVLASTHNELGRSVQIMLNTPSPNGESSSS